jgi:flagellar biosynthesis/type III secretory pathway M-ring protein FliF/YscJ
METHQAYQRWSGYFRSLSPGGRWAVGLLAAIALAGAGYLAMQRPAPAEVELLPGETFAAEQLPAVEAAFRRANLTDYAVSGGTIRVPRGREPLYKAALAEAHVQPADFGAKLRAAVNGGSVLEIGSLREQQRMKIALQDTLAEMIRAIDGVENAYVIYDIDHRGGLRMEKLLTAAVSVKLSAGAKLDAQRTEAIRRMVVGAIAGMKPENVAVCDLGAAAPAVVNQPTVRPAATSDPRPESPGPAGQSWQVYAAAGLALALLPALWLMLRGRKAPTRACRVDAGHDAFASAAPPPHFSAAAADEAALNHEISALIEDDPQAAAEVLRGWIAQAG